MSATDLPARGRSRKTPEKAPVAPPRGAKKAKAAKPLAFAEPPAPQPSLPLPPLAPEITAPDLPISLVALEAGAPELVTDPPPAAKPVRSAKKQPASPAPARASAPVPPPAAPVSETKTAASAEKISSKSETKGDARVDPSLGAIPIPNFEVLSVNMGKLVEKAGKAMTAYMRPLEQGKTNADMSEHVSDAVRTLGHVAEYWLADPARTLEAQTKLSTNFMALWANTMRKAAGEETQPVVPNDPSDKRFSHHEWRDNPFFDFLRQAYSISSNWADELVEKADVDAFTRQRAHFYVRQLAGALSPSNFVATNPEILRETLASSGENLVRGMDMFAEDVEAGGGSLRIRQSDTSKFKLGVDMASTPGKVIFRNDLIELIQYAPTTETVYKRPLLIVPPWINKFYVLDLNPEKSFIRWAVAQGLTVFVVSWVNPDERHADKGFDDYMREGIFASLDAIEAATGERQVSAIGYCVGGTLLSVTLAYMAAHGDNRIASATLFTTQVDFRDAGDLKVFVDEARIRAIEEKMQETGYLEGGKMASAFNMLRPNELIWSYFVNNYMKGKEPAPFDLLAWNSDSTRMPAANHSFYLRNCYLENTLTRGEMVVDGTKLDLKKVTIPIYNLAAREDHIAPARSVFTGSKYFGGPMRYVLAGSGHIAGVVNPAWKPKYQYWIGETPKGSFEDWVSKATEHKGSWWVDWIDWVTTLAPEKVAPRVPGDGKLTPICDAPGEYVTVKS